MYLTSKNFKPHGLDLSKVDFISSEDFAKHFRHHSKAITRPITGDVLVGIIGTLGEPYVVQASDHFGLSSSVGSFAPIKMLCCQSTSITGCETISSRAPFMARRVALPRAI